jgi:hypothetical protein
MPIASTINGSLSAFSVEPACEAFGKLY